MAFLPAQHNFDFALQAIFAIFAIYCRFDYFPGAGCITHLPVFICRYFCFAGAILIRFIFGFYFARYTAAFQARFALFRAAHSHFVRIYLFGDGLSLICYASICWRRAFFIPIYSGFPAGIRICRLPLLSPLYLPRRYC